MQSTSSTAVLAACVAASAVAALIVQTGCREDPDKRPGTAGAGGEGSASDRPAGTLSPTPPPVHEALPPDHPPALQGAAAAGASLEGVVLETLEAGRYVYLRLRTANGEEWAAVPAARVEYGKRVTVANAMLMSSFESKSLKRTFEKVWFGTLAPGAGGRELPPGHPAVGGERPHARPSAMPPGHPAVGQAAKEEVSPEGTVARLEPPEGGLAIAALLKDAKDLSGKVVKLRGKVVKYNSGIMDRNWLHIRDGSGTAGGGQDITVTTRDESAIGKIVVVEGKVALDRDFGAGYHYAVLVEDARVTAE